MKHKILIVDDKPENIRVLMEVLESDYALVAATSGQKALEMAHKEPLPDLILLDVIMPEMNGFEVCQSLKADAVTKHIPVIFVTSINEASGEETGLSAGAIDYLHKPIVPDLVRARVKNHLELKAYRDDLEKKISEETVKRMEQQELLVRQSRLAAMGEMMSAITHQWAQPLNAISMSSDMISFLLEDEHFSVDEVNHSLENIHANVNFMGQTMRDFKNYFKPNKNKQAFPLKQEIDTVGTMLSSQLKHASITVYNEIDSDLTIYGIPSEFKQIILNLLSNAKDAIKSQTDDKGPGEIWFRANQEGNQVILKVEDTGGGIPEKIIEKVFDDYFTTKGESGTGIGLAMTKMIVEEGMGGQISVSNSTHGACFILSLPTS